MDIVSTICDLAGVPSDELEGESFLPILFNEQTTRCQPMFWEHQGNRAVRDGKWKLVHRRSDDNGEVQHTHKDEENTNGWELYNMEDDRTELHDLAPQQQEQVRHMAEMWLEWAKRVGVKRWPLHPLPEGERDWSNVPWLW